MKVTVAVSNLEKLLTRICVNSGLSALEAAPIVTNYLDAELLGKSTHGLSKFCFESKFFSQRVGSPQVVVDTGPLLKVDGNKEVGPIAAQFCVQLAAERAKKYGVCILGLHNIQRYGILSHWVNQLAKQKLFGVLVNTCESAMTGFKGTKKVLGTNPIAFTIPTKEKTYTVDMATSKVAMSLIWKALREEETLPDNTFFDQEGEVTIDPSKAKAVQHFGGIKGFSIALLVQLLSGSVFGFKMASEIKSFYDIGYVFIVVDPSKVTSYEELLLANQKLIDELVASGAVIPGSRSANHTKPKQIEISSSVWDELQQLGKNV